MALLYEEIMKVPGLTGSWSDRLNSYGQRFFGSNYTGSYDQNIQLYNNIQAGNWGSQQSAPKPTQPEQVTPFLNQQQQQDFVNENQLQSTLDNPDVQNAQGQVDQAFQDLQNGTPLPVAPNLEQTFGQLREQYDVKTLEDDLNNLKAAEQEVYARLRIRSNNEKGQRVGLGVISGRVSEIEQQEREELDFVQRQITTRTNQVNSAYSLINTILQLKTSDFNNALQLYNAEFNKNVKMYEIAKDNYRDVRDFTQREKERAEDNAKANLQIYANLITTGSLQWDKMDRNTQLAISKLEVQSGLGIGFLSSLDLPLSARIQQIGTITDASGNKYANTMIINKDGSWEVKKTFIGVDGDFVAAQARAAQQAAATVEAARIKAESDQKQQFFSDQQDAQKTIRENTSTWSQTFETMKAKYGLSNADTDRMLGVPDSWIRSGKPGWEWANQTYGQGIKSSF